MNDILFHIWLVLGVICIVSEFLVPGLVLVFIGLGALTTYALVYLGIVSTPIYQIITFLLGSITYLLGLRTIILSYFPTNTVSPNINEDEVEIGKVVDIDQDIIGSKSGRIQYQDTTWNAKSSDQQDILRGQKAMIQGRENITYIVKKIED